LVFAAAVFAALPAQKAPVAEVEQGRVAFVSLEDDVAAFAAVASCGSAERHELFAAKGGCAVSAVACDGFGFNFVYEMHGRVL